jgi:hypothetical protein
MSRMREAIVDGRFRAFRAGFLSRVAAE